MVLVTLVKKFSSKLLEMEFWYKFKQGPADRRPYSKRNKKEAWPHHRCRNWPKGFFLFGLSYLRRFLLLSNAFANFSPKTFFRLLNFSIFFYIFGLSKNFSIMNYTKIFSKLDQAIAFSKGTENRIFTFQDSRKGKNL